MNPLYHKARFWRATPDTRHLPPDEGLEVAFAGRSNAGKSSALNAICQQRALARTSKTPGRTQQIVFFNLDEGRNLVDLPGYGYAKVPEKLKRQWYELVEGYLAERRALQGLILVMDVRHPLTDFDQQMLEWAAHAGMPVHILLTKADKLKRGAANNTLLKVRRDLEQRYEGVDVQLFSASSRQGVESVHDVLDQWFGGAEETQA